MTLFVSLAAVTTALTLGSLAQDPAEGPPEAGQANARAALTCPEPLSCEPRWAALRLAQDGRIVFAEPELEVLARVLAEDLAAVTGLALEVAPTPARSGDIVLTLGYLPEELRENPEAFFIEVLDHVLISGQSADGVARATGRFLQLVRGEAAASADAAPAALVTPVRLVDAPSARWRIARIDPIMLLDADQEVSASVARCFVASAHLAGLNAIELEAADGFIVQAPQRGDLARLLLAEAERRRITLAAGTDEDRNAPLRVGSPEQSTPPGIANLAARLEREGSVNVCARSPFDAVVTPNALGPDAATTERRLARFLYPIAPTGRADGAPPLLGVQLGQRAALGEATSIPVGWAAPWPNQVPPEGRPTKRAALAGEAWHSGLRGDALDGAPELERVLARVSEASERRAPALKRRE